MTLDPNSTFGFIGNLSMPQLTLTTPRYDVILVRNFAPRDMRKHAFEIEQAMAAYVPAPATFSNVPINAPPEVVRFTMKHGPRQLVASNKAVQLSLDFENGVPSGKNIWEALTNAARTMDKLHQILTDEPPWYCGIIVTKSLPATAQQSVVAREIASNVFKHDVDRELKSMSCNATWSENGIDRLVEVSQYRTFRLERTVPAGSAIHIDVDFEVPSEEGVQVKFDANDKPRIWDRRSSSFEHLRDVLSKSALTDLQRLCGPLADQING